MGMKLLDAMCGIGGTGKGFADAGFEVTGIDNRPQPDYPFEFKLGDAMEYIREHGHEYDLISAGPMCWNETALTKGNRERPGWEDTHTDQIGPAREALKAAGRPYVMENVQGSTVRRDITLCGERYGLQVIRHRYFELGGWSMEQPAHLPHRGRVKGWRHGVEYEGVYYAVYGDGGGKGTTAQWREAMGIDWSWDRKGIAQAIPPAYTRAIGTAFLGVREAAEIAGVWTANLQRPGGFV